MNTSSQSSSGQSVGQPANQPTVDIYSGEPVNPPYMVAIMQAYMAGKRIEYANSGSKNWKRLISGADCPWDWARYTFRVDPMDKPKKLVPLDISDLGPTTWVRGQGIYGEQLVVGIKSNYLFFINTNNKYLLTDFFANGRGTHEYSSDRKTWHPTHKEVAAD